jgi:molecular chaperone GrpE
MSDSEGPKVDIPDELAAELEGGDEVDPSALQKELAELSDKYLRLAAEFENFKRRTLRERQELLNYGTENLIKELLGVVDNLERALVHVGDRSQGGIDSENLSEGVELTHRSLLQALEKSGVAPVEAQGASFDPKVHEALRQVPSAEHEPGTVLEVYQKGYLLKDRLLRPALVAVSGPAEPGSD